MASRSAPNWPGFMRRSTAARYCDMTASQFEAAVASGDLPLPQIIGGEERWSLAAIDKSRSSEDTADWRANQPGLKNAA